MNIIMLRGLGRENEHWRSFVTKVSKSVWCDRVVGVDLPGNGKFYKLSSPLKMSEYAEFIHLEKEREFKNEAVLVIAISLGAMVAIELAHQYPNDVKGLVLMNTSCGDLSQPFERLKPKALVNFLQIMKAKDPLAREEAILKMVSNRQDKQDEVASTWAGIAVERPVSVLNLIKQLAASASFKAKDKRPRCQTLIMSSMADQMVNYRASERLANEWAYPLEVHESSGHELVLDAEDWVLEKINTWVQSSF